MLREVDLDANVMLIDDFVEEYELGLLTQYDGIGYYGYENSYDDDYMVWNDFVNLNTFFNKHFTHVHWYNR